MPSIALVVCGAPLAIRVPDVIKELLAAGWDVSVIGTPASRSWLDQGAIESATGKLPLFEQRMPSEAKRGPSPDRIAVCPLTFNSGSKLALGITDTYAAGVLCEALGTRTPMIVVPMINERLWAHPAWEGHLAVLRLAGVQFLDPGSGQIGPPRPVRSGSGPVIVDGFDPSTLVSALGRPTPSS